MTGNVNLIVPEANQNDLIPTELVDEYGWLVNGSQYRPTWLEMANSQKVISMFGESRTVKYVDNKNYLIIQFDASRIIKSGFSKTEWAAVYNLRQDPDDQTDPSFANLSPRDLRGILNQLGQ